jgi:hypothetical protein
MLLTQSPVGITLFHSSVAVTMQTRDMFAGLDLERLLALL